jgi:hypothetical protein
LVKKEDIVFLVSPQNWGKIHISKHHYAIELAKLGNLVYFLEPPIETKFFRLPRIKIIDTEINNLKVVKFNLFFSYYFKFHLPVIHNLLILIHRKILLNKLGLPHIVLSFDLVYNFPLKHLNCKTIFFAADEPKSFKKLKSAEGANLIVSVSQHILDIYYDLYPKNKMMLINHGVSEEFLDYCSNDFNKYDGINIGLSGNFMFGDIDYKTLNQIIVENIKLNFHLYGPIFPEESNIGADFSDEYKSFYSFIKDAKNVFIHGVLMKKELAMELNQMDAFLICYNPHKSQSSGSNSHKILEYLSTGKVIVSSNFSHYNESNLFQMDKTRNNLSLPLIFSQTIANLAYYNRNDKIMDRRKFAFDCRYSYQISRILNE